MKYIILTCLLVLAQLSFAQDFNPSAGIVTPKDYSTVVPYENVNGKIIINVDINGKPSRLIFDTGAAITCIDEKILDSSNHSTFSVLVRDQSGKRDSMSINKLNHIRIGEANFSDIPIITGDFSEHPFFKYLNVDGLLGSNLLTYTAFRISSTDNTITFTDNPSILQLNKEKASEILFPFESMRVPFVKVNFINKTDTITEPVMFDVGANHLYRMQLDHFPTFIEQNIIQDVMKGTGSSSIGILGNADVEEQFLVKIPQMEINGAVFNGLQVETVSGESYSTLGTRLFDYGNVVFDYINALFYFEPFNKISEVNEKLFLISPTVNDGKLVVGIIWDTDLENQISIGDQIVSVDDIDYTNITMCDLVQKGAELNDKNRATFGIKTVSGEVKKITLERK